MTESRETCLVSRRLETPFYVSVSAQSRHICLGSVWHFHVSSTGSVQWSCFFVGLSSFLTYDLSILMLKLGLFTYCLLKCKWSSGWSIGLVTFRSRVRISLRAICKQPWASCEPTVCSGQLSILPFAGREMSSSLRATGWRHSVADWGAGMSAYCIAGPVVR